MAKFRAGYSSSQAPVGGGAAGGSGPPAPTKKLREGEARIVHPGVNGIGHCLGCGGPLEFCELFCADHKYDGNGIRLVGPPWINVSMAFCRCGMWIKDDHGRVRLIRYTSEPFMFDGKPIVASRRALPGGG